MLDAFDPFRTFVAEHPDFNRSDERSAVEQQLLRDDLIRGYVHGTYDLDTVMDCLAEHGLDPDVWLEQAADYAERIVTEGIEFCTDESGLLLPQGTHGK